MTMRHTSSWAMTTAIVAGIGGFGAGLTHAAPGTWQDPTAGWEAVYQASSNLMPWQLDGTGVSKTWLNLNGQRPTTSTGDGYLTTAGSQDWAALGTDAVTSETALQLNHPAGSPVGLFALRDGPGSGSTSDEITIDFRVRQLSNLPIGDPRTSNRFSLYMNLVRPPNAAQLAASGNTADEQFFQIRFRENNLFMLGASTGAGTAAVSWFSTTQLDRQWHDFRILWDPSTGGAQFFMDGDSDPLEFTYTGLGSNVTTVYPRVNTTIVAGTELNQIDFGDYGATDQASLAYVRMTKSEFASVIPEPASVAALGALALATLTRRRRR